jgi:hypothetical protein
MSDYYKSQRVRNLYDPASKEPYKLSRSKIDLFLECPRCFYLDRRLGIGRPPGYPFSLNSAVDALLKKEFDIHRAKGTTHPLMKEFGIDAIPLAHENMDAWRDSLRRGIQYLHESTNLLLTGGVDDIWITPKGELIVADYKATSKTEEVTLDAEWQRGYKRQVEFYQWLLRQNGFKVNKTAYFVYCNGDASKDSFNGKLEFKIKVLPYTGDDSWVEKEVFKAKELLDSNRVPKRHLDCDYCSYSKAIIGAKKILV